MTYKNSTTINKTKKVLYFYKVTLLMKTLAITILILGLANGIKAQAFFTSKGNGNWTDSTKWNLVSGVSTSKYPKALDSVIIFSNDTIRVDSASTCKSLTVKDSSQLVLDSLFLSILTVTAQCYITETALLKVDNGILTITGTLTIDQKADLIQNAGVISILGAAFVNAPILAAGSSTMDIKGGAFTCAGALTLFSIAFPSTSVAELKIQNSVVSIFGVLTTVTSSAKITFTGTGSLILGGIITITDPNSFTAGTGTVVYIGIPSQDQSVAALTYHNLVISGIANDDKIITGTVKVLNELTLLSDKLKIDPGGILNLENDATIIRTFGKLLNTPTFLGQVNVIYNNVLRDTTGPELPIATTVLKDLTISNISGIQLNTTTAVNGKLSLLFGELFTNNYTLFITNPNGGTTNDPAIERTIGYVNGKICRTIGTSTGIRIFPVGTNGAPLGYREFKMNYTTAPTVAGKLCVEHVNVYAPVQSGLPILDDTVTLVNTAPYYWKADAINGLTGGNYNLTLTGQSTPGVTNVSTLRTLKRAAAGANWVANGTSGINSGTITAPIVERISMSGFSEFTIAGNINNPLPINLVFFKGTHTNAQNILEWQTTDAATISNYTLEKSTNGITFTAIATIPTNGATGVKYFSYIDANTAQKDFYYRLKIKDQLGNINYSSIIFIKANNQNSFAVYPTLVSNYIFIQSADASPIYLYNEKGQQIKNLRIGNNDLSALPKGFYWITTQISTIKIVKQ
jgi:hypothetical protein